MNWIARAFQRVRGTTADRPTDRLAREQLRLALANLAPNAFVMPLFSAVICALFARWISLTDLLAWWSLVTLGGVPLGIVGAKFLSASPEAGDTRIWIRSATSSHLLFALCWSSMALFLWTPGSDLNHLLLQLILACTLAGNMALSGACRPLTINGYAVHGLAFVLVPWREAGPTDALLSLLALLFVCYMAYMSLQIYDTARRMLTLANEKSQLLDEKNKLIAELSHSKLESERARFESDRANRAKSQFLANMSHELRTPLNAVIGFAEMLKAHMAVGKTDEYAEIIRRAGSQLLDMINDILDLSKIESGQLSLSESVFSLPALIADCVASMRMTADAGRLRLVLDASEDLPDLLADERSLRQMLFNLVSNAVKFTRPGGTISIGARLSLAGEICLYVRDTGVGIAEEDLTRVFESFGQGRHDVVNEDHGTGLGLPIVRGLAEAHGGRVIMESEVNKGTCVTVCFPAARARVRREIAKIA